MDDEEALRTLLQCALTTLGYEVETARDGDEAIALCEGAIASGRSFDAALLDLTVTGGMGGAPRAAVRLKELDPVLKLIVSSGYSDAPIMSDYRNHGFDGVIPKPWVIAEISEAFRRRTRPEFRPVNHVAPPAGSFTSRAHVICAPYATGGAPFRAQTAKPGHCRLCAAAIREIAREI